MLCSKYIHNIWVTLVGGGGDRTIQKPNCHITQKYAQIRNKKTKHLGTKLQAIKFPLHIIAPPCFAMDEFPELLVFLEREAARRFVTWETTSGKTIVKELLSKVKTIEFGPPFPRTLN